MSGAPASLAGASMRWLYAAAGAAAGGAVYARSLVAAGDDRERFRERSGLWDGHADRAGPWLWIHAASVGEAGIAVALAHALAAKTGDMRIVITSTTPTGRARVLREKRFESRFFPIDFAPFVKRILEPGRPALFVAVETEIWPETLRLLGERAVPVAFVNARLSDRSLPRYRRLLPLIAPLLGDVARLCARDQEAAARWRMIGVPERAIDVTGNIKFDLAAPAADAEPAPPLFEPGRTGPIFLAASTHDGEEDLVLGAFRVVRGDVPGARLLLVPRHPPRSGAVVELARSRGLRAAKWGSESLAGRPAEWPAGEIDVVVLDRVGLLLRAYASAIATFVGGSANAGPGGHNLLEAAIAGCPLAAGPHLENVRDQRDLLSAAGAIRIAKNVEQLSRFWIEVARAPEDFRPAMLAARSAISARRGALARTVDALLPLLSRAPAGRRERTPAGPANDGTAGSPG